MKKLICVLLLIFSVVSFACDGDNGCTCLVVGEILTCQNITNVVGKYDEKNLYTIHGFTGILDNSNVELISYSSNNVSGEFKINDKIIKIACEPTYGTKTYNCGSNECKNYVSSTITSHNHYVYVNDERVNKNCTLQFRKTSKLGIYKLIYFKVGDDILLNNDDKIDQTPNFKFPVINIDGFVATKNSSLKVENPYYGKDTTEARLQYEWTDPISNSKNTGTITVKNPQVYNDESIYTFGKNVFKNISINTTVSVKYKMYYTNGIQEYTTSEKTVLLQPIKGLK